MYIVVVTAQIKPDKIEDFRKAILDNAKGTRKEPGNIRFDVLQGEDDPTRFTLYEVYKTKDDFTRHQQTPHYLKWKELATDWMAGPRTSTKNHPIFFGETTT